MKIEVKDCHIAAGTKGDCHSCPIALALKEQIPSIGGINVSPNTIQWNMYGKRHYMLNHAIIYYFIINFDSGLEVKPFSFEFNL